MIWFRLKKLERKLAAGELSEKAGLQYLLTWIVFFAVLFYVPGSTSPYSNDWWEFSSFLSALIISIAAIQQAFRINRNSGNADFLKRFLSLSLVIGLRFSLVYSLLWLAYKIFMYNIPDDLFLFLSSLWLENIADMGHTLTLTGIYSLLLLRSFRRINLTPAVTGVV